MSNSFPHNHHFFSVKFYEENPKPGTCCIFNAAEGAAGQARKETQRPSVGEHLFQSLFASHLQFHHHSSLPPPRSNSPASTRLPATLLAFSLHSSGSSPLTTCSPWLTQPPQRRQGLKQTLVITSCRACIYLPAADGGWSRCRVGRGRWKGD